MRKEIFHRLVAALLSGALVWTSGAGAEAVLILRSPESIPGVSYRSFQRNQERMRLETQALSVQAASSSLVLLEHPGTFPFWIVLWRRWIAGMNKPVHPKWPDLTWGTVGAAAWLVLLAGLGKSYQSSTGSGLKLACGIFGLIWWLDPAKNQWEQLKQIRDYLFLVMDAVASRGPQAAGIVLFVQNRKGDVVAKRFRIVNEKHVILSKVMIIALQIYVLYLFAAGYKPLPYVEIFAHVRYATQGTRTHKNTHPLQFQPTTAEWSWEFKSPGIMERRQTRAATLIAKNGDVDWVWLYGQWVPQAEVKEWLIKVLNLTPEHAEKIRDVNVDSITVGGFMNALISQRRWVPAARMAYAFSVARSTADRFPTEAELEQLAQPFEAAFNRLQDIVRTRQISDYSQFSEKEEEALVSEVLRAPLPGIPEDRKEAFVRAAVHGFLHMDPKMAMIFYLQRTKGHPDNSASCKVVNTLYPHQVVFGAHKQPASIAIDPEKKRIAYASLEVALAGRVKGEARTLPLIINLRDAEGEVLQVTPTAMSLYNLRIGRDFTAQELHEQHRIIPNDETNPYWSELPDAPKTTRVEQSLNLITKVFAKLRDDHNNPESWNYQTTDEFWDDVWRIGIYKDIVTKSRVSRIEDYSSLADAIDVEAARLLERRKPRPQRSEEDHWEQVTTFAEHVYECVQAFDYVKVALRDVIRSSFRGRMDDSQDSRLVSQAAQLLRERLAPQISEAALVEEVVQAMQPVLSKALADHAAKQAPSRKEIEILALEVLDVAYLNPMRLHDAYAQGWVDAVSDILFDLRSIPGELGRRHPRLQEAAGMIQQMLPAFDTQLNKSMDRRDPNIIIFAHSEPLWMAEHLSTQIMRAMPALDVMVDTGNKMLESLHNPSAIQRRRHEFRLQLSGHKGYIRFGKRSLVIFIDQNGQSYMVKGSAAPIRDLFNEYGMQGIYTQAGRFFTPLLAATGGVPHPDVPFNKHSWSTLTGWVPEEPKGIVPATINYQLSGRILPRGPVYLRSLFPTYRLLECKISAERAQDLWDRGATTFVDQEVPAITGVNAQGQAVPSIVNSTIISNARRWAKYVLESPITDHVVFVLIWLVAFHNVTPAMVMGWLADHLVKSLPYLEGLGLQWQHIPDFNSWGLALRGLVHWHGAILTFLHSAFIAKLANFLYFWPFMRWGVPFVLRVIQRRRKGDRRGKRTIDIAAPPHVRQTLEMFVRGLFSHQTFASQAVQVEGGSASDHFLLRFARVIVPGTLLLLHVPDGGRSGSTAGKSSAYMVGSQAKGLISWGRGPEVVAVGEHVDSKPLSVDHGVSLGHPGYERGTPENDLVAKLEETIYGDLKAMIFGFVLFTRMAIIVSRTIPWMRWPLDSTLVGQDPTTRAPFGAPVSAMAETNVDESLPAPSRTPAISLRALAGLPEIPVASEPPAPPPAPTSAAVTPLGRLSPDELDKLLGGLPGDEDPRQTDNTTLLMKKGSQARLLWGEIVVTPDGRWNTRDPSISEADKRVLDGLFANPIWAAPFGKPVLVGVAPLPGRAAISRHFAESFQMAGKITLDADLIEDLRRGVPFALETARLELVEEMAELAQPTSAKVEDRAAHEVRMLWVKVRANIKSYLKLDPATAAGVVAYLRKHRLFDPEEVGLAALYEKAAQVPAGILSGLYDQQEVGQVLFEDLQQYVQRAFDYETRRAVVRVPDAAAVVPVSEIAPPAEARQSVQIPKWVWVGLLCALLAIFEFGSWDFLGKFARDNVGRRPVSTRTTKIEKAPYTDFSRRPADVKPSTPAVAPIAPAPEVVTGHKKIDRRAAPRKAAIESRRPPAIRAPTVPAAPPAPKIQPVLVSNASETLAYLKNLQGRLPPAHPGAKNAVAVYIDIAGQLREISMASMDLGNLTDKDAPTPAQVSRLTSAVQALQRLRRAFSTGTLKQALLEAFPGESAEISRLWGNGYIDGIIESTQRLLRNLLPARAGLFVVPVWGLSLGMMPWEKIRVRMRRSVMERNVQRAA